MPIRQLASDVAAKIAAGEVVERPASVVKELIENSIDAGATQIRVDLVQGGLQLIRVTDNGCGIASDELSLALARHATSKVTDIQDLEHISSLGFRGEALASIAAVADVTLLSRPRDAEQGAQISASNGQLSEVTVAASPEGTTLTVRDLFSAVPARRKFLKSRNTEVGHCHHLLEQYALAYPEIRFSVTSDGRPIFSTPGDGKLFSVLVEVYGLQVAEQMVPVQGEERPEEPEYPVVTGYTSRPTCYKSTRQHISFFVNRRWVMSRMLTAAVEGAYHSLLLTGRHPISVINIRVPATLIDVNVHPAKTEIRFLKERRIFAAILRAVRQALLEEPEMPRWNAPVAATTASAAQHEAAISEDDFDEEDIREIEAAGQSEDTSQDVEHGETSLTGAFEEAEDTAAHCPGDNPWMTVIEEESGTQPPHLSRLWQSHVQPAEAPAADAHANTMAQQPAPTNTAQPSAPAVSIQQRMPLEDVSTALPLEQAWQETGDSEPQSPITQTRRLPRQRVIGQLAQSYIVTEGEDGMYLVDQHAAHERILLERMVASLQARKVMSQLLLTPITLELSPAELEAIEEHRAQLEGIGFSLEFLDHHTIQVGAIPNVLSRQVSDHSLHELLVDLTAEENLGHTETWEERALANVACKAAIKAHYFLTSSEMREMLEQLEQTKAPYSCCHGRPTMIHFGLSALEREFGRR
ncbi:MAG TPA: DNA mismatch repair endonuclease MutL [Ktedonobacteraceae bacterium]|jgi:DNA mismatch repair protein MutL